MYRNYISISVCVCIYIYIYVYIYIYTQYTYMAKQSVVCRSAMALWRQRKTACRDDTPGHDNNTTDMNDSYIQMGCLSSWDVIRRGMFDGLADVCPRRMFVFTK